MSARCVRDQFNSTSFKKDGPTKSAHFDSREAYRPNQPTGSVASQVTGSSFLIWRQFRRHCSTPASPRISVNTAKPDLWHASSVRCPPRNASLPLGSVRESDQMFGLIGVTMQLPRATLSNTTSMDRL